MLDYVHIEVQSVGKYRVVRTQLDEVANSTHDLRVHVSWNLLVLLVGIHLGHTTKPTPTAWQIFMYSLRSGLVQRLMNCVPSLTKSFWTSKNSVIWSAILCVFKFVKGRREGIEIRKVRYCSVDGVESR